MRCSASTVRRKCSSRASIPSMPSRPRPPVRTFGRVRYHLMRPTTQRQGCSRGERAAYTPQSLLAVAVEVFNQRGYDGTSMEDLAHATGITKSSIYHHVRGKE